jgi:DNA recombination protein RmuC
MHTIMRDILFQYMSPLFITLICIGIVIVALLLVLIFRKQDKDEEQDQSFLLLQDQLEKLRATVEGKLERSQTDLHQALHRQNTESTRLIQEITKELTEVKEGNKQVFSMTEQLQNLEKVLTHQKQRGNLGEASLELILSNMLAPGQYEMQYYFKNGEVVDAVIHTKEGIIPIDAKYSLDNYQRLMNAEDEEDTAYFQDEFKKILSFVSMKHLSTSDQKKERFHLPLCLFRPKEFIMIFL